MKKDWVTWLGCFCLFGAGAVWAQIPIGTNFFVVPDVHDLFEIFSSIATVVAVVIAAIGVNTWKHQIKLTADHDLARKVAVCLSKYREAVLSVWNSADSSHAQVLSKETLSDSMRDVIRPLMQARLDSAQTARTEMKAVVLECKAIWGDGFFNGLPDVFVFEEECSNCTSNYISIISVEQNPIRNILRNSSIRKFGNKMKEMKLTTHEEVSVHLDGLLEPIMASVQEKLIK